MCIAILMVAATPPVVRSEFSTAIHVIDGYLTIQEAINNANAGDTIHVPTGIYYEHVAINKTVSLFGENCTAIIDGSNGGTVVEITANNVTISGFKLQNSGWGWTNNGIYVYQADNCEIKNNILFHNCHNIRLNCSSNSQVLENRIDGTGYGIRLISSINCTAINNTVSNCIGGVHLENATDCIVEWNCFTQNNQGIRMYSPCTYNRIFENNVVDNVYDGMIEAMPGNTTFFNNSVFHNNFVNSMYPFIYKVSGNIWDNGYPSGGNYWSQYNGTDSHSGLHQNETGSDGMGDTPYLLDFFEADRYPLIHPYGSIRNLNTSLIYLAIQSAIDASDTLNGQTLQVSSGTYYEHVSIDKSLKLVGENRTTTIIDGAAIGTVLYVNADNVSITGFTIANSGLNYPPYGNDCGVLLNHSNGSKISDSLVMNNRIGIYVFFSRSSFIERNAISSNLDSGIWLWYSGNNTLTQNEISNNTYNFGVFGGSSSDFNNSISDTNTVDGRPIRYLSNVKDEIIDEQIDIGALYLINCVNITVRNLNLSKNGQGLFCYNVTESRIENVTALRNNYGICLQDSNDDTIGNSSCLNNWVGIYLQGSDHNVIENSITANCEKGISLYEASYNNLSGNTISDNLYGIRFFSSHSNRIVDNNLIENSEQVDMINSYQDTWDNGFEGNFWSNYNGSDTNRDGVGETSHVINTDNSDGYPLLGQFSNFVIHANGSSFRFAIISNSTILGFNYYDTNSTIRLTVNGTDGTDGFCRMRIPRALASSEISVIIDDGSTEVLYPNYTLRDDGYYRWVYFAYHHSQHEILVIPEFASLTLLAAIMATACCCLLFRTRKTDRRNARRTCACLGQ